MEKYKYVRVSIYVFSIYSKVMQIDGIRSQKSEIPNSPLLQFSFHPSHPSLFSPTSHTFVSVIHLHSFEVPAALHDTLIFNFSISNSQFSSIHNSLFSIPITYPLTQAPTYLLRIGLSKHMENSFYSDLAPRLSFQ